MSVSLSQKDVYALIFKEYPDVVNVSQMSQMLGIRVGRIYKIPKLYIFNYLNVIGQS